MCFCACRVMNVQSFSIFFPGMVELCTMSDQDIVIVLLLLRAVVTLKVKL